MKMLFWFVITLLNINLFAQQDIFEVSRNGTIIELNKLYNENPEIINYKNEEGYTPLVLACYSGNVEVVSFLIDNVSDINGTSTHGTPLMAAVYKGYTEIVSILLEYGVNVDVTDVKGTTAAHYAVMFKNYDIVRQLVKAKANFEIKNNIDKSALDFAKMYNDKELNQLLNQ